MKQQYFVHPSCSPNTSATTFRSAHIFQRCFLYCILSNSNSMLVYVSFSSKEWAIGIEGYTLLLCSNTAFRLSCDKSMNKRQSCESYSQPNASNTPLISLQKHSEPP